MEEPYEICSFCGESFKGEEVTKYPAHHKQCRESYNPEEYDDRIEDEYWYGD